MIYIRKNFTNTVVLELSQSANPTLTNWLFEFIWDATDSPDSRFFTTTNLAGPLGATERYDQFTLIESATGSTGPFVSGTAGIFLNPGQYTCNIFGTAFPVTGLTGPLGATTVAAGPPTQTVRMVVSGVYPGSPPVYNNTFIDTTTPSVYQ